MLHSLRKQPVPIEVEVPRQYQDKLLLPSYDVLLAVCSTKASENPYMHCPEQHLKDLPENKRNEALEWLLENRPKHLTELSFENQTWVNDQTFRNLIQGNGLDHIETLNLSGCRLSHIPELKRMELLGTLDIRNNRLTSLNTDRIPPNLTEILASGNLISTVDFNPTSVPYLKKIEIGSDSTEFISLRVLREFDKTRGKVILMPQEFRPNLIFPSWSMLDHRTEDLMECLKYFHKRGTFLWYEERPDYIYSNILNILELHQKLFRHDLEDFLQYDIRYSPIIGTKDSFDFQKNYFIMSGFLSRKLL